MSTFYGGEQLAQVVNFDTTIFINQNTNTVIYTVPSGFYGELKFIFSCLANVFPDGAWDINKSLTIYDATAPISSNQQSVVSVDIQNPNEGFKAAKLNYTQGGLMYNYYMREGDRIVFYKAVAENGNYRFRGTIHLYKLP